ncbi:MAG TPA: TrkA family potassium uptake protein [Acholeplasma sp.]|nr:TrkA family potassium uptake protein [Acholeplasma sp.]
MRIIIVGGKNEADYMIGMFLKEKHQVLVINEDEEAAKYIADHYRIPVMVGDPTKSYVFEDANAYDYDVIVALTENDIDNYITCLTAKNLFRVKKAICRVLNPKRVDLFKKLGIHTAISSIYMLGQIIKEEANVKNMFKTLTMEDDQITITEIEVIESYGLHGKQIMNLNLPPRINISCILRGKHTIIPNGKTTIELGDKLLIVSATEDQKSIYKMLKEN